MYFFELPGLPRAEHRNKRDAVAAAKRAPWPPGSIPTVYSPTGRVVWTQDDSMAEPARTLNPKSGTRRTVRIDPALNAWLAWRARKEGTTVEQQIHLALLDFYAKTAGPNDPPL